MDMPDQSERFQQDIWRALLPRCMARRKQREMRREGQVEDDWGTEGVVDLTDAVSRPIISLSAHLFLFGAFSDSDGRVSFYSS